jgi:hypothetical protein
MKHFWPYLNMAALGLNVFQRQPFVYISQNYPLIILCVDTIIVSILYCLSVCTSIWQPDSQLEHNLHQSRLFVHLFKHRIHISENVSGHIMGTQKEVLKESLDLLIVWKDHKVILVRHLHFIDRESEAQRRLVIFSKSLVKNKSMSIGHCLD